MSLFIIYSGAFSIDRFGHTLRNQFLIGRMDTSRNVTAASKKIGAAASLLQAAHAAAVA
jgi:hypothetical protein